MKVFEAVIFSIFRIPYEGMIKKHSYLCAMNRSSIILLLFALAFLQGCRSSSISFDRLDAVIDHRDDYLDAFEAKLDSLKKIPEFGGVLMASVGLLESVMGFSPEQTALMMTIYLALDGYGPACNVTGDGAIAILIDRFFRKAA